MRLENRGGGGDKGFNFLPYLNSSLFIRDNALEILDIGTLDDDLTIQIFESTQTAHTKDKTCKFLTYLFDFLNAFDFGKESNEDSTHKDLIRSSVLGAVFEKLNGYKEGSFYTPSFITSYMCRESLSKIVIDKFNAAFAWSAQSLEDLRKQIDRDFGRVESQAKRLLEGIKICDPSVGSGHFLVSALNEMIAIYHKLGLLGFGYKDLQIKDDEIHLTTKEGETFAYKRLQDSNHAIQIALFTLKKSIIENNLFGVDINPNSCNIARLRLWIELLKNAYYLNFSKDRDSKIHKLQTLPNIDINIKCGNSLISHIDTNTTLENFTANLQDRLITAQKEQDLFLNQSLNSEIKDIEKKAQSKFQEMRENAESYKDENDKQVAKIYKDAYEDAYQYLCELFKRNCDEYINFHQALKEFFYRYGYTNLTQLELETKLQIESYVEFFEFHKSVEFERKTQREIPQKELENLLNLMQIYEDFENKATFEWRFAFPEVLDSNGDFLGFDLIIGNPPYIRQEAIKDSKESLKHYKVFIGTGDLYTYFYELGYNLLRENGILNFITSNKWCRAAYGEPLRRFLLENTQINTYLDLNGVKVFESAAVDTSILQCAKTTANANHSLNYANPKDYNPKDKKPLEQSLKFTQIPQDSLNKESFTFSDEATQALKAKIEKIGTPLKDWDININYGIKTGYNEAFIIDSKKREEILNACANEEERARTKELIKPILRGRNIKRYSYEWAGLWIIGTFPALKLDIDDYPAVKRYLESFMPRIAQSGEKGCRKKTSNKWFETQDNIAYYDEFAKPKISWQRVTQEPSFIIESGYYLLDSMAFLTHYSLEELRYLLGFLNSKAIFYYFKNIGHLYSDKGFLLSNQYVERFPIPKISNISKQTHKEIMECVREILTNKKQDSTSDTKALESRLDSLIYQAYGLNEKEINLIESELSTRERERERENRNN